MTWGRHFVSARSKLVTLGPVQLNSNLDRPKINKSTPVDSDVELNSPNSIQFEPKLIKTACKKTKLLVKYGIIIYAFNRFGT